MSFIKITDHRFIYLDIQCVPIYFILFIIHFIKISKLKFSCYIVFISE